MKNQNILLECPREKKKLTPKHKNINMIQILHIPGLQYEGETPEQAEERDRRIIETNRRLRDEWLDGRRQRHTPMKSMQQWAQNRGIFLATPM